jgi:TPR repeat protein
VRKRFGAAVLCLAAVLWGAAQDGPPPGKATLQERAEKGDAQAEFTLGTLFEAGRSGRKKDFLQAEHWYRLSAEHGNPFAQASLGILYRFGKGVHQDYVEAYKWFSIAAAGMQGSDRDSVAEMRDFAAKRMTPQQIEEARQRASSWKPVEKK